MRALKLSLSLIASLYLIFANTGVLASEFKEQRLAFANRLLQEHRPIQSISCSVDQAKTCQDISARCVAACRTTQQDAYTRCMNICNCNLYNCKMNCGDNATMPDN